MKSWWENVSLDFYFKTKVQRYGEPFKNLPELYISPRLLSQNLLNFKQFLTLL